MYDHVRCDHPLPKTGYKLPVGHAGWQTKSFDPLLDLYVITSDGRLLHEERKMEWREDPESPLFRGYLETVESWMVEVLYHGVLNFYDSFRLPDGKRLWAEFDAYYTRGGLEEIEVKDLHEQEEVRTKTVELGGEDYEARETGLGIDVIVLGEELEVEREDEPPEDLPRKARHDDEEL